MAARLEQLAREWQDKYPQIAKGLDNLAKTARQLGAPESFSAAKTVTPEAPVKIKTLSRDQIIVPSEPSREALALLKKAETAGLGGIFAVHRFSDVRLTNDTQVQGWNKKPEQWYWDQTAKGTISSDSAKLPGAEVLIDKIKRPNYSNGRQLHENDPLAPFLRTLRKEKKLPTIKGIPDTSRFGISPDELYSTVFAEMANRLEFEVRLPTEIEFNISGNFAYPHFGEANTAEWLHDKFGGGGRLVGGRSGDGGLTYVFCSWSVDHHDYIAFRPLVVVSPKA